MIDKVELRKQLKTVRKFENPDDKSSADGFITEAFLKSDFYLNCSSILIYVSYNDEIDTFGIIRKALADNKTVAVPHCEGKTMQFYQIATLDELISGAFGIPTVNPSDKSPFIPDDGCICVIPGLGFDFNGGRLGYGGGFYDRYFSNRCVPTVALSYNKCLCESVPMQEHDIAVDCIITENEVIKVRR